MPHSSVCPFTRLAIVLLASLAFVSSARAHGPAVAGNVWLQADFNAPQPLGPIGTGGATDGQPVSVSASLDATIVPAGIFPTRSLELERNSSSGAAFARFEFLESAEIDAGVLFIRFDVHMPALDDLNVDVSEQGTNQTDFGVLRFTSTGMIEFEKGIVIPLRSYTAGETIRISMGYDFDADTIEIQVDGVAQSRIASANIAAQEDGIGAIVFRRPQTSSGVVAIGNLDVRHVAHAQNSLLATFNGTPLGPLGSGGPAIGQPVSIDPNLVATVIGSPAVFGESSRAVQLVRATMDGTSDRAEFTFLDEAEFNDGIVSLRFRIVVPDNEVEMSVYLRERDSAGYAFANFGFSPFGTMTFSTAGSPGGVVGDGYQTGELIDVQIEVDLDQDSVSVLVDGNRIVDALSMPTPDPEAMLGRILFSMGHNTLERVIVDDVDVRHFYVDDVSSDVIFAHGFESVP